MPTETIAPQVPEGLPAEQAGSQVPAQTEQSAGQEQNGTSTQVESGDLKTQAAGETRTPSEFYASRKLSKLERQMQTLTELVQSSLQNRTPVSPAPQPQAQQLTNDDVIKDPIGSLKRLVQSELQPFRNEIPQHIQSVIATQRMQVAEQEALKLIRTNGSVKADPEGEDRIAEILYEEDADGNSLNKYSAINPKHAAQLALSEYNARYGGNKRSQSVPTKAQMQTTATAVTQNAPQANLEQEAALLYRQVLADPSLMQDKDYKAKLDAFSKKAKMETLLKNQ